MRPGRQRPPVSAHGKSWSKGDGIRTVSVSMTPRCWGTWAWLCLIAACSEDVPPPVVNEGVCADWVDARTGDGSSLAYLADPLAMRIFKASADCPRTFAESMALLRLTDDVDCRSGGRIGLETFMTSTRAQLLHRPEAMRPVVTRTCSGRSPEELLFHLPEVDAANPELEFEAVHAMAYDPDLGAYNFYALADGSWTYFGHGSALDEACARCHADGAPVMLAAQDPWLHWAGALPLPGATEVVDRTADLGHAGTGPELALRIQAAARRLYRTTIAARADPVRTEVHQGSVRTLLEPLFCPEDYGLGSAAAAGPSGAPVFVEQIPADALVDPWWGLTEGVPVDPLRYLNTIFFRGSSVPGIVGSLDTYFGLTYVRRSAANEVYVGLLVELGLVDEEFIADVLMADFMVPLGSATRCQLLDYAPDFSGLEFVPPESEPEPDCCAAHPGAACQDDAVAACVCADDPFCCAGRWDAACVRRAATCDACGASFRLAMPSTSTIAGGFVARLRAAELAPSSEAAAFLQRLERPGELEEHRERVRETLEVCADRSRFRDPDGVLTYFLDSFAHRKAWAAEVSQRLDPAAVVTTESRPLADLLPLDPFDCVP